jgi:hypothetical protein
MAMEQASLKNVCPFIVGEEVKKGNFFALSCPTRGINEQMHYYFSK